MSHNQIAQFVRILGKHFGASWDWLDSNREPWGARRMISESKWHNPPHIDVDSHNIHMIPFVHNSHLESWYVCDGMRCNQRGSFYWIAEIHLAA